MSLLSPPLQAFVAVAREKTVIAAARGLGLTQTGVTQRIRSLEAHLGATLFIRSRRGMMLSSEGQALLRYCQGAGDLEGQALAQIQKAGRLAELRLRISGPTSLMRARLIPACLPLMKDWPLLLLDFHISDEPDLAGELRAARSQLVVIPPEEVAREMESKLLRPEKYLLVGSARWKGRATAEIVRSERIIDFDSSDQMTFSYLRKFGLIPATLPSRAFVNSTESLCEIFCRGLGYGVLSVEFAEPWLKKGQLIALNGGRALESRLALAWYPQPQRADYFKALLGVLH